MSQVYWGLGSPRLGPARRNTVTMPENIDDYRDPRRNIARLCRNISGWGDRIMAGQNYENETDEAQFAANSDAGGTPEEAGETPAPLPPTSRERTRAL